MTKLRLYKLANTELLRLLCREEGLSQMGNNISAKKAASLKKEIAEVSTVILKEERRNKNDNKETRPSPIIEKSSLKNSPALLLTGESTGG